MNYNFSKDLKSVREILGMSQSELADQIGVEQVTISRNESGKTEPSPKLLESVYSYIFDKKVRINKLKEMLWKDDLGNKAKLLFHGAKTEIDGEIDVHMVGRTMILDRDFILVKVMNKQYHLFLDLIILLYIF